VATIITAGEEATTDNRVQRGPTQKQQEDSVTTKNQLHFNIIQPSFITLLWFNSHGYIRPLPSCWKKYGRFHIEQFVITS